MGNTYDLVQQLLRDHPSKAAELLMIYLQDEEKCAAAERYIGQHQPQRLPEAPSGQQYEALPPRAHHRNSSLQQASARHNIQNARHIMQTPPTSAGSVKSATSGLAAAGMEKISFLSCDDDGADQPVIARRAPGRYNLIGDGVAYGRGLSAGQFEVDESILVHTSAGAAKWVAVKAAVNLTWRRRNEFKTNMDTFYVVSARLLDSDVVLGSEESMERQFPSEVQEAHSPQGRYPPGFVTVDEYDQAVPPQAPTAPIHPYQHQYQPPSPEVQRAFGRVGAMHEVQRMRGSEPPAQVAPSAPANYSPQSDAPIPIPSQGDPSDELEIEGYWGRMPISMSVDISGSGEQFFQAFQCMAIDRKRGDNLDRQRLAVWLRADEDGPEDEAYYVSLDQGALEKRWKMVVRWIRKNKNSEEPHLYATVEIADG
ncbi:uncharacterized protein J4E92_010197 [Alternaria infectoria]|uniref:uncharacterized protein n=1 Tax=Alternaria infectoria TaxID=45303 RepID=UPI002220BFD2|nr:uncharacterized protein J4E92_010197 [Alternaria infectoria]KAI4911384.1 hypothetical protein J4E92_010197 [Alternaria infectoria]